MKKLIGLAAIISTAAFALQVYPIPIKMDSSIRYKELHIEQDRGKYQVFIKTWNQNKGEDILRDTKDVVAYPKLIQAPKRVKIYRKQKGKIEIEKAYRIILKELNVKPTPGETKLVKTLSIPVFIEPVSKNPKLEVSCYGDVLKFKNSGNIHYKILSINKNKNMQYILPNQIKEVQHVGVSGTVKTNRGDFKYQCIKTQRRESK